MIENSEASKSFSEILDDLEDDPIDTSKHVTLARALEDSRAHVDACQAIRNELNEELKLFRAAILEEKRERKAASRRFDIHDLFLLAGLSAVSGGITVAYHWAYALITVGAILSGLSVLPLLARTQAPPETK